MGGAVGHMSHPFDLGWVNTGSDLLDFFERAKVFVEKKDAAAVKIDGVNVSFKVVDGPNGKEFAVDRGSLKMIDIDGITMDKVDERFPEGHGMRRGIRTLLTILNGALPSVTGELASLGMMDDPTLFLNTEYVEGTTNITKYDENFLAIHGLNQFYQKTAKSGVSKGNTRPGAERPEGVKAPALEISYDPKVMESFVKKLNIVANKYGFQVYGSVPTEKIADIDYSATLAEPFTVKISDDREITKPLGDWLSEATNPRYKAVKLKDGKRIHSLHKELYKAILAGSVPITDLLEDTDAEAAIYGAVIMHATRMLGNDVLRSLTSPMGDVMSHEGIVLRDEKLFNTPSPVKITGDFIVDTGDSPFQKQEEQEYIDGDEILELDIVEDDESDLDPVNDTKMPKENRTIAIVPGAFKPPHMGHVGMVKEYADIADEVVVLISKPLKAGRRLPNGEEITADISRRIWEVLVGDMPNVSVEVSSHASPMTAAYEYVGDEGPLAVGTKLVLGASTKGDDWKRWSRAPKYIKPGVTLLDPQKTAVLPGTLASGEPFNASDMRELLGQAETDPVAVDKLKEYVGEANLLDVFSIVGVTPAAIDEMSAMGGGAVGGFSGPIGSKSAKKKKKEEDYYDLGLIDEIYELLIGRGSLI